MSEPVDGAAPAAGVEKAGLVYYRAGPQAFPRVVAFLQDDVGLPLTFSDGATWAAFDGGGVTIAVEGGELPGAAVEGPILGFRVSGLDAVVAALSDQHHVGAPTVGGHERRSHVQGPLPSPVVLYEPTPG